jgi:Family of unknown function (DUF5338)
MASPLGVRKARGTARVVFIALMDTIVAELERGHTAIAIYTRHQRKLGNSISYQQFSRYVRQLREDGAVKPPLGRPSAPSTSLASSLKPKPIAPAVFKTQPEAAERPQDARHDPVHHRGFNHDATERPGDRKRLLGED